MTFKKHSALDGPAFKGWRKSLALTQGEAATALGLKLHMVQHYEKGTHKIPRSIALACWALSKGKSDFNGSKAKAIKSPLALLMAGEDEQLREKKLKKLAKLQSAETKK